ncbi:MAG TPA: nuclear transport factor 2 family protein [Myxococcota bacterium]|nr:nuclear transport factor 2 family protein [Myxococcota bacterium]
MTKLDPKRARALATRAWQAVSSGDVSALERIYNDDIVWHVSGRGPRAGDHRGREAVLAYLASVGEAAERFEASLEDVLVGDDRLAFLMRASGRREGRTLEATYLILVRLENGRLAEVWSTALDQYAVDAFWA